MSKRDARTRRSPAPAAAGASVESSDRRASGTSQPSLGTQGTTVARGWWIYALGVLLYVGWFFHVPMTDLPPRDDGPWRRWELLTFLLVPEVLWEDWAGKSGEAGLADRLPIVALAAAVFCSAGALGSLALGNHARWRFSRASEAVIWSAVVGLGLLSELTLLVGLAGGCRSQTIALAIGGAIWFAFAVTTWRRFQRNSAPPARMRAEARSPSATIEQSNRVDESALSRWLWRGMGAMFVAAIVLGAFLPPVDFDVREYHMQAPKEFWQQGRIGFVAHNVYANMPLGAEMLSLAAMQLAGDWQRGALAGKTLTASYTLLAAAGLWLAGIRLGSPRFGRIAAVLYLSTPWTVRLGSSGLIEGAVACNLLFTAIALALWHQQTEAGSPAARRWLLLAGFLAGQAMACKYPAALFVVVPGAALATLSAQRRVGGMGAWRAAFAFVLAAAVAAGPWLAKNFYATGNPVYPLLCQWFGPTWRAPEFTARWNDAHAPHGFDARALTEAASRVLGSSPWASVALVPFVAVAWRDRARRRMLGALGLYVLFVLAAWWGLTHRIDRFWIPIVPLVALAAALGLAAPAPRGVRHALEAFALLSALLAVPLAFPSAPGWYQRYFLSLANSFSDPRRQNECVAWLNTHLEPGEVVLSEGDAQVFDLRPRVLYHTAFDPSPWDELVGDLPTVEVHSRLLSHGVRAIYVNWGEITRYRQRGNYGFRSTITPEAVARLTAAGVLRGPAFDVGSAQIYFVAPTSVTASLTASPR